MQWFQDDADETHPRTQCADDPQETKQTISPSPGEGDLFSPTTCTIYFITGKQFRSDLHKLLRRCFISSSAPAPIPAYAHAHALGAPAPIVIAAAAAAFKP